MIAVLFDSFSSANGPCQRRISHVQLDRAAPGTRLRPLNGGVDKLPVAGDRKLQFSREIRDVWSAERVRFINKQERQTRQQAGKVAGFARI
jgi:hypothetical protein